MLLELNFLVVHSQVTSELGDDVQTWADGA